MKINSNERTSDEKACLFCLTSRKRALDPSSLRFSFGFKINPIIGLFFPGGFGVVIQRN